VLVAGTGIAETVQFIGVSKRTRGRVAGKGPNAKVLVVYENANSAAEQFRRVRVAVYNPRETARRETVQQSRRSPARERVAAQEFSRNMQRPRATADEVKQEARTRVPVERGAVIW